jgi:uncharacterized protein (TIGR03435 family)
MRAAFLLLYVLAQAGLSFEVVSIKPASSDASSFTGTGLQNNRWTGTEVTVRGLIQDAYESNGFDMPDRVIGGPAWLDKDRFDLAATAGTTPTQTQLEGMIRAMLVDRFHLATHLEKRTMQAFELTVAKSNGALGPTLRGTTADCRPQCSVTITWGQTRRMTSDGVEMTRLAFVLATVLQRPVINRTNLDGLFELSLDYAAGTDLTVPVASDAPSIFTAVEEQLGLKLRSVRASLDVLVVDRADKPTFD